MSTYTQVCVCVCLGMAIGDYLVYQGSCPWRSLILPLLAAINCLLDLLLGVSQGHVSLFLSTLLF